MCRALHTNFGSCPFKPKILTTVCGPIRFKGHELSGLLPLDAIEKDLCIVQNIEYMAQKG